ncbi:ScbR family autoregulator-binding transcription factor [Streptomyces zingiberis]|uniref:TetR family transcriptional regulator n=1 Tax=Streptomyces zingiberis TaxID=2053010 RepID=A0ABX1BRT6_9ACTN|nr:ScbR family autoregulator-binding transcription factor [Streptomyces zingiberis]NJQ00450.1 TetR family transcriptional regulator [Streptomyces zingiberis]
MPKQDRAVRTRQTILLAAAGVFEERGYGAAKLTEILDRARVTKGALYFHFASKKELALAVLQAQIEEAPPRVPQSSRAQEFVDLGLVFAHRLVYDPLLRGSVRLTFEHNSYDLDRSGPYRQWTEVSLSLLTEARERGELLPHVVPLETARLVVGAYAGINLMNQVLDARAELCREASALYQHIMPSVAVPGVLVSLDMAPDRGARVLAEARAGEAAEATRGPDATEPAEAGERTASGERTEAGKAVRTG